MKTYHHSCRYCPYTFTTLEDLYEAGETDWFDWCAFVASPNYGHMVLKCEVKGCDLDFDANYFYQKYKPENTNSEGGDN